jgi:hypothetical protein
MKFGFVLCCFLALGVIVRADDAEKPSAVVVLNEENFDALTASGKWLVELYVLVAPYTLINPSRT